MIVAGIDEAGYGPMLGPLVVGCAAFEVLETDDFSFPKNKSDDPCELVLPCVWARLRKLISKNRSKTGRKLHVNDSKMVYNPGIGLKELERSVLSFAIASGPVDRSTESFLNWVAPGLFAEMQGCPWYQDFNGQDFPVSQEIMPIQLFAKALRPEMERCRARCTHLAGQVILERPLNKLFDATRNKSNALFSIAARHLDHLLRTFGDQNLIIFCDRQGGRAHYGAPLRQMFDEWSLEILRESDGRSDYVMIRGNQTVRIVFCEKAEAQCLPVAMASMLSKYLRELLMHRFNLYWQRMLPGLAPTAGYYGDGERFMKEINSKRRELGIADHELIRSR